MAVAKTVELYLYIEQREQSGRPCHERPLAMAGNASSMWIGSNITTRATISLSILALCRRCHLPQSGDRPDLVWVLAIERKRFVAERHANRPISTTSTSYLLDGIGASSGLSPLATFVSDDCNRHQVNESYCL